jgi:hypothetical protein
MLAGIETKIAIEKPKARTTNVVLAFFLTTFLNTLVNTPIGHHLQFISIPVFQPFAAAPAFLLLLATTTVIPVLADTSPNIINTPSSVVLFSIFSTSFVTGHLR